VAVEAVEVVEILVAVVVEALAAAEVEIAKCTMPFVPTVAEIAKCLLDQLQVNPFYVVLVLIKVMIVEIEEAVTEAQDFLVAEMIAQSLAVEMIPNF
jgi:hypothetical protein